MENHKKYNKNKKISNLVLYGKKTLTTTLLSGWVLMSSYNIFSFGVELLSDINYSIYSIDKEKELEEKNDEFIKEISNKSILVYSDFIISSFQPSYYIKDDNLYDSSKRSISLKNNNNNIYFYQMNLSKSFFKKINLKESNIESLCLDYSSIDDNFINYLPSSIKKLSLNGCNYITNLNGLGKKCPNLEYISIDNASGLSDLNFIYELSNLKEINLSDNAYVKDNLLKYLADNNIETNLDKQDIINSNLTDEIVNNIITSDMNEEEKIQKICLYVLKNMKYVGTTSLECNQSPLSFAICNKQGVCISYAYLTNILLNKADIESYQITNNNHSWNMVKINGKYYYIDTTNMDGSYINTFLLKKYNLSKFYMYDTDMTKSGSMSSPEEGKTIISPELVKEILNVREENEIKNFRILLETIDISIYILSILYYKSSIKCLKYSASSLIDDIKSKEKVKSRL